MSKQMLKNNLSFYDSATGHKKSGTQRHLSSMQLLDLQKILRYRFCHIQLLYLALTHSSSSQNANYELLEFLGDRVLSLVISDYVISLNNRKNYWVNLGKNDKKPNMGYLVNIFNHLVCSDTLCAIAKKLQLSKYLIFKNKVMDSMLSDCLEAIIGAIYRDQGLPAAQTFILHHWKYYLHISHKFSNDPKMQLQEWTQRQGLGLPCYRLLHEEVIDYGQREFTVLLQVPGNEDIKATGTRKQKAEQAAALQLLQKIMIGDNL